MVSIIDGNNRHREMDSDGEKKLYENDTLILQAEVTDVDEIVEYLHSLVGYENDIVFKSAH